MKKIITIIVAALVCLSVGWIASLFQIEALESWYPFLNKPTLMPPNIVFPIAWTILYILMGIAIGLVINSSVAAKRFLIALFAGQLLINFLWSIGFFYLQTPLLGLIDILLLNILVICYIIKSYPVNKLSSLLFVPYLLWLVFATYLNVYIVMYN